MLASILMFLPSAFQQVVSFTTRHPSLRNSARRALYSSAALSNSQISPAVVSVFDNVLSPACCAELTSDAVYNIGPDVYRRDQGSFSPQDVLIESILSGLGSEFEGTREVSNINIRSRHLSVASYYALTLLLWHNTHRQEHTRQTPNVKQIRI